MFYSSLLMYKDQCCINIAVFSIKESSHLQTLHLYNSQTHMLTPNENPPIKEDVVKKKAVVSEAEQRTSHQKTAAHFFPQRD